LGEDDIPILGILDMGHAYIPQTLPTYCEPNTSRFLQICESGNIGGAIGITNLASMTLSLYDGPFISYPFPGKFPYIIMSTCDGRGQTIQVNFIVEFELPL